MPRGGLDDVEWVLTRSGLFTNSPDMLLVDLIANIVRQALMEIKDVAARVQLVISQRSEAAGVQRARRSADAPS
jgi:hypothetical protein